MLACLFLWCIIEPINNPGQHGPTTWSKTMQADYTTALKLHRSFSAAYKLLSADGNPAGIKSLLAVQKKAANILRLPIVPARKQTYEALEDFVCKFQG